MADRHPNQAPGGSGDLHGDGVSKPDGGGATGAGESGGGARAGRQDGSGEEGGPLGHGGQSEIGYHGPGQLGDDDVERAPGDNSATKAG